ncbi:geranylgeranylglyceryl phosphate synthase [Methanocalculus chunghsingensis]|uniref:Geranylgeranylglyceryl phosphate synthase n=1 Tax=Methanocalculus chunghsingensis TaxID=156457 RepID=A0A8J7W911_9EURY|nr:phosphoglycerol geranylgeranyltransferase [Methanocalculus chunghsingensis]MBR1368433.1 geranylgeranylglyceryl phosphate synthase [Methanocalculus chunghsingensis]
MSWKDWVHITKLDPDRYLDKDAIEIVATSGTDALMLSGTLNVTPENQAELYDLVRDYDMPIVVEPADPCGARFEGIDLVFVPSVLNASHPLWIVGQHQRWVRNYSIDWERVVPEAYIVLNPASSVAKVTGSDCSLSAEAVSAYATVADRYFRFPVVYIEYSGTYGDPDVVKAVSENVSDARIFYGGGINNAERAAEMSAYADTIVVGNAVYEAGIEALKATVRAVR